MNPLVRQEATESAFGRVETDSRSYQPLDTVTVTVTGRGKGDKQGIIRVCDPERQAYFEARVKLENNRGSIRFLAGGRLGLHYVFLFWPNEKKHSRYVNFFLDCETRIASGDRDFDELYPFSRDAMRLGRREYATPAGRFVGYISADTWHFDGIWLRDWIYGLPASRYWETEMTCGLDRFLEQQSKKGMIPDGIERNGHTWRVGLESDVEYIMVLGVWQAWQATGNDSWMAAHLPRLERALNYIRSDPKHWNAAHGLIQRQHSCDTWDFDINGASDSGTRRHVIATCDQAGYILAFRIMSQMYRHLEKTGDADRWAKEAESYRDRAVRLLWDGTKFLHHVHIDPIDHGDFDEAGQLAMGNTWAMTRGLASAEQARAIIAEYRRRQAATGDAYPWWSLQPGYPDRLGYFSQPYCQEGGYANGGLLPWVGGELCRAAFRFGREAYAVELLRSYAEHLRRTGGAQVWYWPDGTPGFRTTNEVPYTGWGMAEWVSALIEGLAGIHDENGQFRGASISPRWAATPGQKVFVSARYAASAAYVAYRMEIDTALRRIHLWHTGSDQRAQFRVLLPEGWAPRSLHLDADEHAFKIAREDASRYICFKTAAQTIRSAVIQCEMPS